MFASNSWDLVVLTLILDEPQETQKYTKARRQINDWIGFGVLLQHSLVLMID